MNEAHQNRIDKVLSVMRKPGVEHLVMVTEDGCELLDRADKNWKVMG